MASTAVAIEYKTLNWPFKVIVVYVCVREDGEELEQQILKKMQYNSIDLALIKLLYHQQVTTIMVKAMFELLSDLT